MLELRPTCEHCNKTLPPDSREARICTYECTFCPACVESVLRNVHKSEGQVLQSRISRRVAARLSDRCEGLCTKAEVSNTPRQRSELLSDHSRAVRTNSRPLGAEESLLLIILDDLWRANLRIVRVKPDVTKSASLAQEIPALIQFDLDLREPLTIDLRKCPLLVQSVFLCGQVLNVFEDGLILGVVLHNSFLPCEWDRTVHGLRFDVTPTPNLGQPMC